MTITQLRAVVIIDAIVIVVFTAGSVVGNYLPLAFAVAIAIGMVFQIWAAARRPRPSTPAGKAPEPARGD